MAGRVPHEKSGSHTLDRKSRAEKAQDGGQLVGLAEAEFEAVLAVGRERAAGRDDVVGHDRDLAAHIADQV